MPCRSHGHHHDGQGERYPHVQGGPSVLDIGGDIGALVATMRPETAGTELHLVSDTDPAADVHTGVWRRRAPAGELTTAVFGQLRQGWYGVLGTDGAVVCRVEVHGGQLATVDLR